MPTVLYREKCQRYCGVIQAQHWSIEAGGCSAANAANLEACGFAFPASISNLLGT